MDFPVYLHAGPWRIHPHPVFELLGYAVAFRLLLARGLRKDPLPTERRSSIAVAGMVGAVVGAKLLVLLQHFYLLRDSWQQFLLLFLQGKTIVGAIAGGIIAIEITKKRLGIARSTGDVFAYPLLVGTAIGRVGCFLTGLSDRTSGTPTGLPWGIDFGDGMPRHPTQLYEILFLFGLAVFLNFRDRYARQEGDLFKFYAIAYFGFRLLVDFLKPDASLLFGLSAIQIACILGLVCYRRFIPALFEFKKKG